MGIFGGIRKRIGETLGGESLRESQAQETERVLAEIKKKHDEEVSELRESIENAIPIVDDLGDTDEILFRTLESKSQRNLTDRRRERVLKIVYWLYLAYPMAKRGVEVKRDFIMGDGFMVEAEDEEVQEVLEDFLEDPDNRVQQRFDVWMAELSLYGELFLQAFVNDATGKVKLGFIDPLDVRKVITDPNNALIPRAIKVRTLHGQDKSRTFKVINLDNDTNSETYGKMVGDVFVFQINKASNAQRGNSDLLPVVDWIEAHEQFLFGIHEGNDIRNSVVWDIEVQGADKKKIQELKKEYGRIKKGMTRIHNEKVKINAVSPNMASQDQSIHASLLKHHIAAGLGIPVEWLSEKSKSNVNNDSITAGVPATRSLRHRQKEALHFYTQLCEFAIDKAIEKGKLKEDANREFKVTGPSIYAVDVQRIAQSLLATAQALMVGVQNNFTDEFVARDVFTYLLGQFGIDLSNAETALLEVEGVGPEDLADMKVGHMSALMVLIEKLASGNLTAEQALATLKVAFPKGREELFKKLIDAFFADKPPAPAVPPPVGNPNPEDTKGLANGATGRPPKP